MVESEYEKKIQDIINYYMKKEMFSYLDKLTNIWIKEKQYHSAIGLQENTSEIFVRNEFLKILINKCVKEIIFMQLKDLKKVYEEL